MIFILFSSSGVDFNPRQFLENFDLQGMDVFMKGERMKFGKKKHIDSGFAFVFENAANAADAASVIGDWLVRNGTWLSALKEQAVKSIFSIGLTVGDKDSFVSYFEVDDKLLSSLADLKIGLNLCAYPTSDE